MLELGRRWLLKWNGKLKILRISSKSMGRVDMVIQCYTCYMYIHIRIYVYTYTQCFTTCNSWITCPTSIAVPDACTLSSVPCCISVYSLRNFQVTILMRKHWVNIQALAKRIPVGGLYFNESKRKTASHLRLLTFSKDFLRGIFFKEESRIYKIYWNASWLCCLLTPLSWICVLLFPSLFITLKKGQWTPCQVCLQFVEHPFLTHEIAQVLENGTIVMEPNRSLLICEVFLQFNSQVYWSENSDILDKYRKEQFDFLESEINSLVAKRIKRLVLLTHIPPFMDTIEEEEGWANWKKEYREKLLTLFAKVQVPMLFLVRGFSTTLSCMQMSLSHDVDTPKVFAIWVSYWWSMVRIENRDHRFPKMKQVVVGQNMSANKILIGFGRSLNHPLGYPFSIFSIVQFFNMWISSKLQETEQKQPVMTHHSPKLAWNFSNVQGLCVAIFMPMWSKIPPTRTYNWASVSLALQGQPFNGMAKMHWAQRKHRRWRPKMSLGISCVDGSKNGGLGMFT